MAAILSKRHKTVPTISTTAKEQALTTSSAAVRAPSAAVALVPPVITNNSSAQSSAIYKELAEAAALVSYFVPSSLLNCSVLEGSHGVESTIVLRRPIAVPFMLQEEVSRRVAGMPTMSEDRPLGAGGGPSTPAMSSHASNEASFSSRPSGRPSLFEPATVVGTDASQVATDPSAAPTGSYHHPHPHPVAAIEVTLMLKATSASVSKAASANSLGGISTSGGPTSPMALDWAARPMPPVYKLTHQSASPNSQPPTDTDTCHGLVGLGLSNSALIHIVKRAVKEARSRPSSNPSSYAAAAISSVSGPLSVPTPTFVSFPTSPASHSMPAFPLLLSRKGGGGGGGGAISGTSSIAEELVAIAKRLAILEVDELSFSLGCQVQGILDGEGEGDETPEDNYHRHLSVASASRLASASYNGVPFLSPASFPSVSASTAASTAFRGGSPPSPALIAAVKRCKIPMPPSSGALFAPNGAVMSWCLGSAAASSAKDMIGQTLVPLLNTGEASSVDAPSIMGRDADGTSGSPPMFLHTSTDIQQHMFREDSASSTGAWQASTRAPTMVLSPSSVPTMYSATASTQQQRADGDAVLPFLFPNHRQSIVSIQTEVEDRDGTSKPLPTLIGLHPSAGYLPSDILHAIDLCPTTNTLKVSKGPREVLHRNGMLCAKVFFRKYLKGFAIPSATEGGDSTPSFDVYPFFHLSPTAGGALPMLFQSVSSVCLATSGPAPIAMQGTSTLSHSGLPPPRYATSELEQSHITSIVLPLLAQMAEVVAPMHSRSLFWVGVAYCNVCLPLIEGAAYRAQSGSDATCLEDGLAEVYSLLRSYASAPIVLQSISIVSQVFAVAGDMSKHREASLLSEHVRLANASRDEAESRRERLSLLQEYRRLLLTYPSSNSSAYNEESATLTSTLTSHHLGQHPPKDGHLYPHTTPSTPYNNRQGSWNTSTPPTAPLSRQTTLTPIPLGYYPPAPPSSTTVYHPSSSHTLQQNQSGAAASNSVHASPAGDSQDNKGSGGTKCVVCLQVCLSGSTVVWCVRCGHGGHKDHLVGWVQRGHSECALGCGCQCDYVGL